MPGINEIILNTLQTQIFSNGIHNNKLPAQGKYLTFINRICTFREPRLLTLALSIQFNRLTR